MDMNLSAFRPSTIIFCHSLNLLTRNMERLSRQLRQTGATTAIVVSNENAGTLYEIVDRLTKGGMACDPTFHVPVPAAKLEMRISLFGPGKIC